MFEPSPFPHQGPLAPEQVSGRDDLARDLAERLMARRLTALLGPRRYGKTSLLKRVTADLAAVGPDTIWIDLYQLNSMADLAGAIDRGVAATTGPARRILDSIAGTMSLRLGLLGVELSRSRRNRPDPVLSLRSLLEVVIRTAQRHDLVLVFDEFSGVANVDGAAGVLRTELQHHYQELSIVFAGSEPSTMRMLFADQAQPFFAQADLVEIGPLADGAVIEILVRGFEQTGRSIGDVASRVAAFVEGHPQRAMQLADAVWRHTPEAETATDRTWEAALADVRQNVDSGSERLFALLPTSHQKTLRVLASGGRVYGTAGDVLDLNPGTARGAVAALVGKGFLHQAEPDRLVDPLLADWLRRRFPI